MKTKVIIVFVCLFFSLCGFAQFVVKDTLTYKVTIRDDKNKIEPLYVLDGEIITSEAFRKINPNDIKSVNVIKEIAGAALYGFAGRNGVIYIITNKKSKND